MEAALAAAAGGGGSGGPAPFLVKTYEMVDDSATDNIVSWTPSRRSFVVWNPPEFSRLLLPTYFKHSNFSSFIRQLNTYGFRKIDPERWEFANDEFIKDKKHLLKNIHRRKPIHSHSQPPVDPERAALAKEIDKLSRENAEIQARLKAQQQPPPSAAKSELETLKHRVSSLDERQKNLLSFFDKAVQNPTFMEQLTKRIESMDISAYTKKRRLPQAQDEHHFELPSGNNGFVENRGVSRPETANIFQQDFPNTLRLELSSALSDRNLISNSTHSSNEEMGSSPRRSSEEEQGNAQARVGSHQIAPETIDLTDTGTSLTFRMDSPLSLRAGSGTNATPGLQSGQHNLVPSKEAGDDHISCLLNLSLASSPFQASPPNSSVEDARYSDVRPEKSSDARVVTTSMEKNSNEDGASLSSSRGSQDDKEGEEKAAQPARVNDVFWEQFLTERPGASDNEEASSNYRAIQFEEQQDDRGVSQGISKTAKNLGKLSL